MVGWDLIHRDEINVAYILALLAKLNQGTAAQQAKKRKEITDLLDGQVQLRNKRKLIEKFIDENLPMIEDLAMIEVEFEVFWTEEKAKALQVLSDEESLDAEKLANLIGDYLYSHRLPKSEQIRPLLLVMPKLLERDAVFERIKTKIEVFIETYIEGV